MEFCQLELVRRVLTKPHGVRCETGVGAVNVEHWVRRVGDETYWTSVTGEAHEQVLPEEALAKALAALFVSPIVMQIKSIGGLHL